MNFPASEKSSRHPMHLFLSATAILTLSLAVFFHPALASGVFGLATSYSTVTNPSAIALGDFDEDGNLDMAVPSMSSGSSTAQISILYGNGHGGFSPHILGGIPVVTTIPTSSGIGGIFTKDFGNGHLDLVVTLQTTNQIAILMGDGHGNFSPPVGVPAFYATGGAPTDIATADFNGDGFADLAVSDQGGGVTTFLGSATPGSFAVGTIVATGGSNPVGIVAKDLDGDGKADLAVTNMGGNTVSFLKGTGTDSFMSPVLISVPVGPWSIVSADFNGDGVPDLAVTGQSTNNVSVILGNGTGGFLTPVSYPAGTGPRALATGDFGNGENDLAVVNQVDNTVSILLGDGHGSFVPATPPTVAVGMSPQYIVAGDFDGDGSLDLATADLGSSAVSVLLDAPAAMNVTSSTADGTYGTGAVISVQVHFNKAVTVDTTGGTPSLAMAVGSPSTAVYTSGSGTNTLTFLYTVASGDTSVDLDYAGIMALRLNGGTIRDTALTDAALSLPTPGINGSLSFSRSIVISTVMATIEPVLTETVPVPTPGTNNTPSYTFTSDESGTLSYIPSGGCGTATTAVVAGSNTITLLTPSTLLPLPVGVYSSCQITVTDGSANTNTLNISSFTINADSGIIGGGGTTGGGGGGNHGHPAVPYLREQTPVTTPTTVHAPTYAFIASESGNISYGGGCSSTTTFAINGVNTITFSNLPDGQYNSCIITVTDLAGRSNTIPVSPFKIYTVAPPTPVTPPASKTTTPASSPASGDSSSSSDQGSSSDSQAPFTLTPAVLAPPPAPAPIAAPVAFPAQAPITNPTPAPVQNPVSTEQMTAPVQTQTQTPAPVTNTQSTPAFTPTPTPDETATPPVVPDSDFDQPTTTLVDNNDCEVGTSSGVFGTIGDIFKWGFCEVGKKL